MGGVLSDPVAVAYGAGNNSKAMLARMVVDEEPIDLILFADTGAEHDRTYWDLRNFSDWLDERGYPRIQRVRYVEATGRLETLEERCLRTQTLPSIAYGYKACSEKYKARPQHSFMKEWPPAMRAWASGGRVTKLIGFHAGEPHRAKNYSDDKYAYRYPLIEWGWDNEACLKYLRELNLPIPGKSSCFFCPNMRAWEIRALKETEPDKFERALAMERNAKPSLTTIKGLGRDWSWEDLNRQFDTQGEFSFQTVRDEMPCECSDGGYP